MENKINVLGTEYTVMEATEITDKGLIGCDGYCDTSIKRCVINDLKDNAPDAKKNMQEYKKSVVRHELIHAFLYESGIDANGWAKNEEIVEWIAIQFPKLQQAFEEANCI